MWLQGASYQGSLQDQWLRLRFPGLNRRSFWKIWIRFKPWSLFSSLLTMIRAWVTTLLMPMAIPCSMSSPAFRPFRLVSSSKHFNSYFQSVKNIDGFQGTITLICWRLSIVSMPRGYWSIGQLWVFIPEMIGFNNSEMFCCLVLHQA